MQQQAGLAPRRCHAATTPSPRPGGWAIALGSWIGAGQQRQGATRRHHPCSQRTAGLRQRHGWGYRDRPRCHGAWARHREPSPIQLCGPHLLAAAPQHHSRTQRGGHSGHLAGHHLRLRRAALDTADAPDDSPAPAGSIHCGAVRARRHIPSLSVHVAVGEVAVRREPGVVPHAAGLRGAQRHRPRPWRATRAAATAAATAAAAAAAGGQWHGVPFQTR